MLTRRQLMGTATSVAAVSLFDKGGIAQTIKPVSDVMIEPNEVPAGGWAALRAVATHLAREEVEISGTELL
jgi:hypothetical protein